jgi:hypothetical protein
MKTKTVYVTVKRVPVRQDKTVYVTVKPATSR